MAAKIANVMARVESHIKEQAEETMDMLGIPVSCSVPSAPTARDELDDAAFHAMMERSLKEAKADEYGADLSQPLRITVTGVDAETVLPWASGNKCVIVVTHSKEFAEQSDSIINIGL